MKKKGFTLIELLAVILILAIIAVIVTPIISKIIDEAKTLTDSWQGLVTPKNYVYVLGVNPYEIKYETDGYKARFITTDEIAHITHNDTFNPNTSGTSDWFYLDGYASVQSGKTWQTQIATSSQKSAFYWLFDYTNGCTSYGCYNNSDQWGYWTSDAIQGTTNKAWQISRNGALNHDHSGFDVTVGYGNFIRPVVTILKSSLN